MSIVIVVFDAVILRLPQRAAIWCSMLICGGHLVGVSTWIIHFPAGLPLVLVLWLVAKLGLFPFYERALNEPKTRDREEFGVTTARIDE